MGRALDWLRGLFRRKPYSLPTAPNRRCRFVAETGHVECRACGAVSQARKAAPWCRLSMTLPHSVLNMPLHDIQMIEWSQMPAPIWQGTYVPDEEDEFAIDLPKAKLYSFPDKRASSASRTQ